MKMPQEAFINEHLYYSLQGQESFSTQPTGELVVNRLIKGKPSCWMRADGGIKKQRKTLIIADWTRKNWPSFKIRKVRETMLSLLKSGFTIYIWDEETLKPLTGDSLDLLSQRPSSPSLPNMEELEKSAIKELGMTKDALQIIDAHWMDSLLDPVQCPLTRPREFKLSYPQSVLDDKIKLQRLQPIEQIVYDQFSDDHVYEKKLQTIFPGIRKKKQYQQLELRSYNQEIIFKNEELTCEDLVFTYQDRMDVLKLIMWSSGHPITVLGLLQHFPHLKELVMVSATYRIEIDLETMEGFTHDSLEYLFLDNQTGIIGDKQFSNILKCLPNIKQLTFLTTIQSSSKDDAKLSLPQLESLTALYNSESSSYFNKILDASPNIQSIDIIVSGKTDLYFGNRLIQLRNIKLLSKCRTDISFLYRKLLQASGGSLESIDLTGAITGFDEMEPLLTTQCNRVKQFKAERIPIEIFIEHIRHMPKIKSLTATDLQSSDQEFPILSELSEIQLHRKWGFRDFIKFIKCAPNLKKLRLMDFSVSDFSEGKLGPVSNELCQVEIFELRYDEDINTDFLYEILRLMPNLKKIHATHMPRSYNQEKTSIITQIIKQISSERGNVLMVTTETIQPQQSDKKSQQIEDKTSQFPDIVEPEYKIPVLLKENKHRPEENKYFRPGLTPFEFKNKNKTFDQNMIIDKLSQYLTVTQKYSFFIHKMQDGICTALTYLFFEMKESNESKEKQWIQFLKPIQNWDGGLESLTPQLRSDFDRIFSCVVHYQFEFNPDEKEIYIGDNLIKTLLERKTYNFRNPWHRIIVTPKGEDQWIIYDPNFIEGPKVVNNDALPSLITHRLGHLLSVVLPRNMEFKIKPFIPDANIFLKNGGLLTLTESENYQDILILLTQNTLASEAFNGIVLPNMHGIPGWAKALESKRVDVQDYAFHLLVQWITRDQKAIKELKKSIEHFTAFQKVEIITCLLQVMERQAQSNENFSLSIPYELVKAISSSSNKEHYEKQLETWKKAPRENIDAKTFAHQVFGEKGGSYLIECTSDEEANTLPYILYAHGKHINRPVFHVYSPDDLICTSPWIKRNPDMTGSIQGRGGLLYDFLKKHKNPVLIVHYDHFTPSDKVRFNALLDEKPEADGEPLPTGTKVIGIMNINRENAYRGSDFYSRFSHVEQSPLTKVQIAQAKPSLPFKNKNEVKSSAVIDLYHCADWMTQLLGTWKLQGDQLIFQEGSLFKTLQQLSKNKEPVLEIRNGLWHDPEFQHFWHQALMDGFIKQDEREIPLPAGLSFVQVDGYEWDKRQEQIAQIQEGLSYDEKIHVLNPTTLNSFFENYHCEDNKLLTNPGWIEEHKNKTLPVNLTKSLTESQWAKLLDCCKKYGVKLQIYAAKNSIFPPGFAPSEEKSAIPLKRVPPFESKENCTRFIVSNDVDAAVMAVKKEKDWKVIDISECGPSDLLHHMNGKWNSKESRFYFTEKKKALLNLLEKNENVILKGHFSSELEDALMPLLLKRMSKKNPKGQLVLLTSQSDVFNIMDDRREKQEISFENKKHYLRKKGHHSINCKLKTFSKDIQDSLQQSSLSEIEAYLTSNTPWIGMRHLSQTIDVKYACQFDNSQEIAETFIQNRIQLLSDKLASAPYVFITGLTGIGKSTFMQKEFETYLKKQEGKLYHGELNIKAWAEDKQTPGQKILFIDEANLAHRDWTEFEGLFQDPPAILVNGIYCPLTKEHKVVFAGNPVSYGDERTLASLFKNHGNAVEFKPLPLEYIYHCILGPIFRNSGIDEKTKRTLCTIFFDIYKTTLSFSNREVLMSPRELQMMALLTLAHAKKHPNELEKAARYYAYILAKSVAPEDKQLELKQPEDKLSHDGKKKEQSHYLVTPSREQAIHILDDILKLRALRIEQKKGQNVSEEFLYGGLGGVILEGIPAAGKSDLVIARLLAAGFKERRDEDTDPITGPIFYKMPVSMGLKQKELLLRKAFNEGAVVIVDEINSSSMMERLLNTLLMGKDDGNPPKGPEYPGFMIIGTQNPASMAGRRKASTALSRRMMTLTLDPYPMEEITAILVHKGVPKHRAQELAEVFDAQLKKANREQLKPAPTLRNLLNLADDVIEAEQRLHTVPLLKAIEHKQERIIQFLLNQKASISDEHINAAIKIQDEGILAVLQYEAIKTDNLNVILNLYNKNIFSSYIGERFKLFNVVSQEILKFLDVKKPGKDKKASYNKAIDIQNDCKELILKINHISVEHYFKKKKACPPSLVQLVKEAVDTMISWEDKESNDELFHALYQRARMTVDDLKGTLVVPKTQTVPTLFSTSSALGELTNRLDELNIKYHFDAVSYYNASSARQSM
jgi:hypothetical protein